MKLTSFNKKNTGSFNLLLPNKSNSTKKGILNTITSTSLNKSIDQNKQKTNKKQQQCILDPNHNIKSSKGINFFQNNHLQTNLVRTHNLGNKSSRDGKNQKQNDSFQSGKNQINLNKFSDNSEKAFLIHLNQHRRNRSQQIRQLVNSDSQQSLISLKQKLSKFIQIEKQDSQKKGNFNMIENMSEIMADKMKKIKNFMKNKKNNLQQPEQTHGLEESNDNKQNTRQNNGYCQHNEIKNQIKQQLSSNVIETISADYSINASFEKKATQIQEKQKKLTKNCSRLSNFFIGKKIGKGRFGNVFQIQHMQTQSIYALKVLSKKQIKQQQMQQQILLQIKLQMYLRHPNILKLYGFFDDIENIYLVLEYAVESCLFKKLRKQVNINFPECKVSYYARQLIESMKNFHAEYILHRDIKPENIMLSFDLIKLADFGWSVYSPVYKRQTFCGTVDYVSPEIIKGEYYDQKVDIWSLGILLYELAVGKAPFQGKNNIENQTFERILSNQLNFPTTMSLQMKRLIQKILTNSEQRISLDQIYSSEWMKIYELDGRSILPELFQFWKKCE